MFAVICNGDRSPILPDQIEWILFTVVSFVEGNLESRNGFQIRDVRLSRAFTRTLRVTSIPASWGALFDERFGLRDQWRAARNIRFRCGVVNLAFLHICTRTILPG